jgi:hypothetical protein
VVKLKYKWRDKSRSIAGQWPTALPPPEVLAAKVRYVGSSEHKDYPSFAGAPGLRSDAARCEPTIEREEAEWALRSGILRGCICAQLEGEFPRYVWGRLRGKLYQARLINREQGHYKAWEIEAVEAPDDPDDRLRAEVWNA